MELTSTLLKALIAFGAVVVVNEIYVRVVYKRAINGHKVIPGPRPIAFLGNAVSMLISRLSGRFHDFRVETADKYGKIFEVFAGNNRVVMISDIAMIKTACSNITALPHTAIGGFTKLPERGGMTNLSHSDHARHRRAIHPLFKEENLAPYGPHIAKQIRSVVVQGWLAGGDQTQYVGDVVDDVQNMVLKIFATTAFGDDYSVEDTSRLIEATRVIVSNNGESKSYLRWLPTRDNLTRTAHLKFFDKFVAEMIQKRRDRTGKKENAGEPPRSDILSRLLECRDPEAPTKTALEEFEVEGEIRTFLIAAHETTAFSVCFTLYYLALHQEYQQRVRDEVFAALSSRGKHSREDLENDDDAIDQTLLNECVFLDACVKETMRLDSPAPAFGRISEQPIVLDDYLIPAGSMVIFLTGVVHRNPEIYDDPNEFKPERWLDPASVDKINAAGPFAYLPFGAGHRVCIGKRLGAFETRAVVAHILSKVKIELVPDKPMRRIVPFTKKPETLWLKITKL